VKPDGPYTAGRTSIPSFRKSLRFPAWFTLAGAVACAPAIAPFSQQAYDLAVTLKVESLALMQQATEAYTKHEESVRALRLKLDRAYEYAKGRPKNEESTQQWGLLANPDGHLLGGFLRRWEEQSTLDRTFVSEARNVVGKAFDTVIELESGKLRPKDVQRAP
jgi:hypothetical protein